ncbi:hypothetical protein F4823DRAFT_564023 [Ustulina deusta]|nr:hypothetical protein F4823DRAFT_564023 [Ustulina deusta]
MASMDWCLNTNKKLRQCASVSPIPTDQWQPGDIAFLKKAENFSQAEWTELIESGRVRQNATGHPVIILGRSDDLKSYIVTTVSAYRSGEHNNYRPPWEQESHRNKDINGFRAFEGSARPKNNYRLLHLADGKEWPKNRTSWVYIHNRSTVPASTLISYDKAQGELRMTPESFQDLLGHVKAKSWCLQERWAATNTKKESNEPGVKSLQQNRRHNDEKNHQPSPNNIGQGPNTTGSKPGWTTIVAKSTRTATSITSKARVNIDAHRNKYAALA